MATTMITTMTTKTAINNIPPKKEHRSSAHHMREHRKSRNANKRNNHMKSNSQRNTKEEKSTMTQASQLSEKAANHFNKQGYNCAQSVLLAMQEYYGIPKSNLIPKIATAFGGGIGRRGSLCGALTGAIIAIGLKHGTNTTTLQEKEKAYNLALKFHDRFAETFGSPFCRELIGYDLTNPQDLRKLRKSNVREQKCSNFVKKAVEILITLEETP
jgi:C_GCAxxG_C_C family probable redox protein